MKRVFVRGISRSGGTLMATVLDAHRDIAVCYELYQHLLGPEGGGPASIDVVIDGLRDATRKRLLRRSARADRITNDRLRTFSLRAVRSGIDLKALLTVCEEHKTQGRDLAAFDERMGLVEAIAEFKMRQEGKPAWGVKIASVYYELADLYPTESYFLYMLRDGRDIAASRLNVGDFNQSVEQIAGGWCRQIKKFREFAAKPGVSARMVRYEHLTCEPEPELREIIGFLGLPWDDKVLSFQEQDLSIYRNPTGHLSADQVNKPINTTSVGRWKKDLNSEQIAAFESVALSTLTEMGYEVNCDAVVDA